MEHQSDVRLNCSYPCHETFSLICYNMPYSSQSFNVLQIRTLKIQKAFVTYFLEIQMTAIIMMRMPRHTAAIATDKRAMIVLRSVSDSGIKYRESFTRSSSSSSILLLLLLLLLCPMFQGRRGNSGNLSPIIRWQPATSDFKIFQGLFGVSLLIPAALSFRALPIIIPIYRMGCLYEMC